MRRCTQEHTAPAFGLIPVGSLWADDSPYVTDDNTPMFEQVDEPAPEPAKPKSPVRKFAAKKEPTDGD